MWGSFLPYRGEFGLSVACLQSHSIESPAGSAGRRCASSHFRLKWIRARGKANGSWARSSYSPALGPLTNPLRLFPLYRGWQLPAVALFFWRSKTISTSASHGFMCIVSMAHAGLRYTLLSFLATFCPPGCARIRLGCAFSPEVRAWEWVEDPLHSRPF